MVENLFVQSFSSFQSMLPNGVGQAYSGLQGSGENPVFFLTRSVFLEYLLIGTSYGFGFCMSVKI